MLPVYRIIAVLVLLVYPIAAPGASASPPGYSSSAIHVKFQKGARIDPPELLLPTELSNSVESVTPLFRGVTKDKLDKMKESGEGRSRKKLPDLTLWFRLTLKPGTDGSDFMEKLRRLDVVDHAEFAPVPAAPPAITPDFRNNQGYLDMGPGGIDALFSWTVPGGNGSGVKIYDIEYNWNQTHEDLSKANGVPLLLDTGDSAVDPFNDNNHGTAVLGILIADNDTKGVTGISWGAEVGLVPANTALLQYNPAHAIVLATVDGKAGDVILLEQQASVCGLPDFGPVEAIASVFDAIQTAVANGLVVIEAAGNGGVDLDQAACGTAFDRSVRDSGAIIVGAGKPAGSGADRERESFSSFGSRVDLQGWGSGVMTTGYGFSYRDPDDPSNPNRWYRATFNGTSSASSVVTGAATNLQGIASAQFGAPLDSSQIRTLLVTTGNAQLGNVLEHIGPRPDLFRAISELLGVLAVEVTVDIKPGDFPNDINLKSKGVIPVALLSTDVFDANTVDPKSVRFGRNGTEAQPVQFALKDVDGDGDRDLILHFRTLEIGLQCGDALATVRGLTLSGAALEGSDSVRTIGCKAN